MKKALNILLPMELYNWIQEKAKKEKRSLTKQTELLLETIKRGEKK